MCWKKILYKIQSYKEERYRMHKEPLYPHITQRKQTVTTSPYVKVTCKEGNKVRTFWAEKLRETKLMVLYKPLHKDGGDYSKKTPSGYSIPEALISRDLIISEEPAYMHKKYGEFWTGIEPAGRYWEL
jgi:hypothetical protein